MNRPGTRPATSKVPIDTLAIEPAMTIRIEGGMIEESTEVQSVRPTA